MSDNRTEFTFPRPSLDCNVSNFVDAFLAVSDKARKINSSNVRTQDIGSKTADTPGEKVLAHRYLLGTAKEGDEPYLQLGMRLLWMGDGSAEVASWLDPKEMFPDELYGPGAAYGLGASIRTGIRLELEEQVSKLRIGATHSIAKLASVDGIERASAGLTKQALEEIQKGLEQQDPGSQIHKLFEEAERALRLFIDKNDYMTSMHASATGCGEGGGGGDDSSRPKRLRTGVWKEALRDAGIASDKLWIFVELMSGYIGEDPTSLTAEEDAQSKEVSDTLRKQQREIANRVAAFQAEVVKAMVDTVMKQSSLQMTHDRRAGSTATNPLVVVDGDLRKKLEALASGESGRPMYEANVALRNILAAGEEKGVQLDTIAREMMNVSSILHRGLNAEMLSGLGGRGPSVAYASLARNSHHIKLATDTLAAIRTASERLRTEIGFRIPLWVLVEGKDTQLTTRFAQFAAQMLANIRLTSGPSAIYVSVATQNANLLNLRISLGRLVNTIRSRMPDVPSPISNDDEDKSELQPRLNAALRNRNAYFGRAVEGRPPIPSSSPYWLSSYTGGLSPYPSSNIRAGHSPWFV